MLELLVMMTRRKSERECGVTCDTRFILTHLGCGSILYI